MLHKTIAFRFFKALEKIEKGSIMIVAPDNKVYEFSGPQPGQNIRIHIYDWRTFTSFVVKADIGLTESYIKGWWDTNSIENLFLFVFENEQALQHYINGRTLAHLLSRMMYLFSRNTVAGSSKNIHAHYDLGNKFYELWLDGTMSYSSALGVKENAPLEKAQHKKYDRLLSLLDNPKGPLLEIGCGWGGFAERAVTTTDAHVKGITISPAQYSYAKNRLNGAAHISLEDYRHQQGKYDHIVSIEMFEAVGEAFWQTYFQKLKSLLTSNGTAVIQTITVDEKCFELYRKSGDMIRTFIFPGGMLPSQTRFIQEAQKAGLNAGSTF